MSNSKKTREAEQLAKIREQEARSKADLAEKERIQAVQQAKDTSQITPEAQAVLEGSAADLAAIRKGNLTGVSGITRFMTGAARARDAAARTSPTGSASLAFDVANPNLIAMNKQRLDAESANDIAAGVDEIARSTEAEATNNIMNVSGMKAGLNSNLVNFMFDSARIAQGAAGMTQNTADSAWERYKFEKSQKPFWQSALLAGIGGAGQAASAYFGKKA